MITRWYTFGQQHVHRIGDRTFDADCVAAITSTDPRARAVELFGDRWAFEYLHLEDVQVERFYPRGVMEIPS